MSNPNAIFFITFFLSLLSLTNSRSGRHTCTNTFNTFTQKRNFTNCLKLPTLSSELAWKLYQTDPKNKTQSPVIDIIFGAKLSSEMGWLAWGVNPQARPKMVGTRAIVGLKYLDGTSNISIYNITEDARLGCHLKPSGIDFEVQNMSFKYIAVTEYYTIFARLILPKERYNVSRLNVVWQVGNYVEGDEPKKHPATLQNVDSTETIDLISGKSRTAVGHRRRRLRRVHGILNILGWSGLLPIGVIIARYTREVPIKLGWWYRLHVSCQVAGYILGTHGWALGLWLGHASPDYNFPVHRMFGIFIFTFTTLQTLALRLRPKEKDEYRRFWDMYHHFLGYALLVVIVINVFNGIEILKPDNYSWKWAYIGLLICLGFVLLGFETATWICFFNRKISDRKNRAAKPPANSANTSKTTRRCC